MGLLGPDIIRSPQVVRLEVNVVICHESECCCVYREQQSVDQNLLIMKVKTVIGSFSHPPRCACAMKGEMVEFSGLKDDPMYGLIDMLCI